MVTILLHLKAKKRKILIAKLEKLLDLRLKQLEQLELLLEPLKENIKFNKMVLSSKCSVEAYVEQSKVTKQYISKLSELVK